MVKFIERADVECTSKEQALQHLEYLIGTDFKEKGVLFDAAMHGKGDGFILEIGADMGQSAIPMAIASKMAGREKVFSIDIDRGRPDNFFERNSQWQSGASRWKKFIQTLVLCGVEDWVIPIGCDSMDAWQFLNLQLRLLYVDGNHDRPHTDNDILKYSEKLISGGLIFVHDYHEEETGTYNSVNEHIRDSSAFWDFHVVGILACAKKV